MDRFQAGQIALILPLVLSISSQAAVFWTDDFENHLTPNWDTAACTSGQVYPGPLDGCNPSISMDVAHSGTHSLKSDYPNADFSQTGTFYDRAVPVGGDKWIRFYYFTATGFIYSPIETKHMFLRSNNASHTLVVDHGNGGRLGAFALNLESQDPGPAPCSPGGEFVGDMGRTGNSCNYNPNMADVQTQDNQWYCVEIHMKENTAIGVADGSLEMWVNGAQTLGYYNRQFGGSYLELARFDILRMYAQSGYGKMYYDDLSVGDSRIGCGSTPPPPPSTDVLPPAKPRNMRAQ